MLLILVIAYCTAHMNRENFPVALKDFLVGFLHFNPLYRAELPVFYWFPPIVLYDSFLLSWTWDKTCTRIYKKNIIGIYTYWISFLFNDVIILIIVIKEGFQFHFCQKFPKWNRNIKNYETWVLIIITQFLRE